MTNDEMVIAQKAMRELGREGFDLTAINQGVTESLVKGTTRGLKVDVDVKVRALEAHDVRQPVLADDVRHALHDDELLHQPQDLAVGTQQRVIARRDRVMGFSENQRGKTTGDTATDVTYANEAAQGRQGYVRNRYQDGIRRAGKTVAWYLFHTDETVIPLGLEAIARVAERLAAEGHAEVSNLSLRLLGTRLHLVERRD